MITKAVIAVIVAWTITFVFGAIFVCSTYPSAAWGTLAVIEERCGPSTNVSLAFIISNFITDVIILVLPLPMV